MQAQIVSNTNSIQSVYSEPTMTSLELREIVNAARAEHGEKEVANRHFLARVEDELGGELGPRKTFTHPQNGAKVGYYDLTQDQCTLVGMRESKAVRRTVLAKLKALEAGRQPTKPVTALDAVESIVAALREQDNRMAAVESRMDEVETKALGSPRDYYTVAGYASLRGASIDVKRASLLGRKAAKLSREYGVEIGEAHSEVFGRVNAYHVDILATLFDEVAA